MKLPFIRSTITSSNKTISDLSATACMEIYCPDLRQQIEMCPKKNIKNFLNRSYESVTIPIGNINILLVPFFNSSLAWA